MLLKALSPLLGSAPQYQGLLSSLKGGGLPTVQTISNGLPYLLSCLWNDLGVPVLLLVPHPEDARRLQEQLLTWCGQGAPVLQFPEADALPFERLVSDAATVHQRLGTLAALLHGSDKPARPPLVVSSIAAAAQRALSRQTMSETAHALQKGQRVDLESLISKWHSMGYRVERAVEVPGTVCRRGGIIDILPTGSSLPSRIELWGDEIDSIRLFDPASQRSIRETDSVTVMPAQEILPALTNPSEIKDLISQLDMSNCDTSVRSRIYEEISLLTSGHDIDDLNLYAGFFSRGAILDYLHPDGIVVLYRPSEIEQAALEADERTLHLRDTKENRGDLPKNFPSPHILWPDFQRLLKGPWRRLDVLQWGVEDSGHSTKPVLLPFTEPLGFYGKLEMLVKEVGGLVASGQRVVAVTQHAQRLAEILGEEKIPVVLSDSLKDVTPGTVSLVHGSLDEGFALSANGTTLTLLTDVEIFGVAKQRRYVRRSRMRREAFLSDIAPGDFVVHIEHGIARFLATEHMDLGSGVREYLVLEYAEGDKLYVPMDQLDRVAPYIAPVENPPSVTRLGTQEWSRAKARVERSAKEMAAALLSLYASREVVEGMSAAADSQWQGELEDSFPFEETPDQMTTINEVKADMERSKPMDRLVCGDVGYGKTEVALRAAFKAVMSGVQVAILVPTTVLAQQHYATFSERMSPFPVTVDVLSRFRTDKEQREIIEGLANGKVDICIGTHRLLQKDIFFKDLGLVVIDEEQRFGVEHKERFKNMRREVDVLALSATPIPRTLHMSLAGVRDMSTMETPPEERMSIKTYVSEYSDEIIREAILREMDRQGQVFFVHNRVYNIDFTANWLRALVPEVRIGVAHGQMPENQLEEVMLEFSQGNLDVLVCTTIIESGLDIPTVNTLIVNRADRFGLAQLYQLRGRVGRSSNRAYAYFLVPKGHRLTEAAEKRLKTILAATELGSGFRIAMRDLEIRGAGNLLGREQSGQIQAVGFDLYTRILSEAVKELRAKGEAQAAEGEEIAFDTERLLGGPEVKIDIGIPASLPEDYIEDLPTRLGVYKRLVSLGSMEDLDGMEEEIRDRFGPLTWQVKNLLYIVRLRLLARSAGVTSISRTDGQINIRLKDGVGGARMAVQRAMGAGVSVGNTLIKFDLAIDKDGWEEPLAEALESLAAFKERVLQVV